MYIVGSHATVSYVRCLAFFNLKNESIVFDESKEPIFDYEDHVLRSLCAIFLGCDVFPSGVQNLGWNDVWKHMEKEKYNDLIVEQRREKMIEFILEKSKKRNNLTRDDILTLSSSIVNEPVVTEEEK